MQSKLQRLRDLMAAGDHRAALKLAASWPRLGEHRERIQRGWAAARSPETYAAMGYDPDALVADAVKAIRERYGLGG